VEVKANADIQGWIKGVKHGMITKNCSNVSTHLAKLLSARDAEDMDILPAIAVFRMMRREST
jgi:hypothetical protein